MIKKKKVAHNNHNDMRQILFIGLICFFLLFPSISFSQVTKLWETSPVLKVPESVLYLPEQEVILASNINGSPSKKDSNGFISKISLTGEIIDLNFVSGMNAPKGMGVINNDLYVTDIDRVVKINLHNGKVIQYFDAPDAVFLNDLIIAPNEIVYVSDTRSSHIYQIKKNKIEKWLVDKKIDQPNGLNFENGKLVIGTPKGIFSVDPQNKKIELIISSTGNIDGLECLGNSTYLISDWQGKIQKVSPTGKIVLINTTEQKINAADIDYINEKNILIVPTFYHNTICAYQIK